ncbi:MAG: RNA methyltransferase [Chloroflexi bacterium]|nr:RNA methyltransferase [Chloroflexota bacterium]
MITSAQNPKLKRVRALLGRSKERRDAGAFVAEGVRLVEEALAANWPFRFVLYAEELSERGRALNNGLIVAGVETEDVSSHLLDALSNTGNTQGILAVLDLSSLPIPDELSFILIPDQIRDPGNLGTLLRSAAAAGVQAVFLGAHFRLPIHALDWGEIRARTSGLQIHLADMDGASCWETDFRPPLALIVGGEAEGASAPACGMATGMVSIPMPGRVESLNAGVAGAILMFEIVRQRRTNHK